LWDIGVESLGEVDGVFTLHWTVSDPLPIHEF
jgi:hypothetical protein